MTRIRLIAGAASVAQDRSVDPVVLTDAQFPNWSAGPDPTFREPQPVGAGTPYVSI